LRDEITSGSSRCICPKCDGGSGKERSLDVRQEETGVMRLKCFRSSCEWYGITITDKNAQIQSKSMKQGRVFRDPIVPIVGAMEQRLVLDYGLIQDGYREHRWGMNERGDQLVMPILDPYGNERGHVTRTFESPKRCYTFKATAQPWLDHWNVGADHTVIVEDCLSACRVAQLGYHAICLLGTSISVPQAQEIARTANGLVTLALDNDAFLKSLSLVQRHSHIVQMRPILLTEDLKNMEEDEDILKLLGGEV